MLIDTHAHLDFPDFDADLDEVLSRAAAAGVERIITIGTSVDGSKRAVELAHRFPNVFAAIGVHPSRAHDASADSIAGLRELARSPRVVAIGEIGLDYHRLPAAHLIPSCALEIAGRTEDVRHTVAVGAFKAAQATLFEQQLDLAVELQLNVVIHERDAWTDTVEMLAPYAGKLRAVFHCFGKGPGHAEQILSLGHLVSFTGIVTFKKAAEVQETVRRIPTDAFMVETDCPYLAPVPFRGKRCEPVHVRLTAERIGSLRETSFDEIAQATSRTAAAFFRFPGT